MNIIIIGCGKVGTTLADQLVKEAHNVTMIDTSAEALEKFPDEIDAIRMEGNGASIEVLKEAGLDNCDVLIAVTASDELNLLCCLIARKAGHCHTIARVRNPIYGDELDFIKEQMEVSMVINPEMAAAAEISRVLRFPSAIEIDPFARGRVEMLKFKVQPEFEIAGMSVMDIAAKYPLNVLICGVERGDEVTIPGGRFVIEAGDKVSIIGSPQGSQEFFRMIGLNTNQVKNTLIVGGGTTGYYLARYLRSMKIQVKIIEKDRKRCEELSEIFDDVMVIHADGTDRSVLIEEGIATAESFVALTNLDEENVFLSLYAKNVSKAKLVTKINRFTFDELIGKMDLGTLIYPKFITADYILQYVRAMQNSIGSNVENLYRILDSKAEALEFIIREESAVTGVPLHEMTLKNNLLVASIVRDGKTLIPRGNDSLQVGDKVIIVTTHKGLHDITDIQRG